MASSKRRLAPRMVERPGLRNVITGPTCLCRMDPKHHTLEYCGYSVAELVTHSSFEEVAYLLLHNELPDKAQLAEFRGELARTHTEDILSTSYQYTHRAFLAHAGYHHLVHASDGHVSFFGANVSCNPMHMLRGLVSVFGANDMVLHPSDTPQRRAARVLAIMPLPQGYFWLC